MKIFSLLDYSYVVYNDIEIGNLTEAEKYYKKTLENIDKFSTGFLDKITALNSLVVNTTKKEGRLNRKISIQKSFDNRKISFKGIYIK